MESQTAGPGFGRQPPSNRHWVRNVVVGGKSRRETCGRRTPGGRRHGRLPPAGYRAAAGRRRGDSTTDWVFHRQECATAPFSVTLPPRATAVNCGTPPSSGARSPEVGTATTAGTAHPKSSPAEYCGQSRCTTHRSNSSQSRKNSRSPAANLFCADRNAAHAWGCFSGITVVRAQRQKQ